jgi:hypothetical protein
MRSPCTPSRPMRTSSSRRAEEYMPSAAMLAPSGTQSAHQSAARSARQSVPSHPASLLRLAAMLAPRPAARPAWLRRVGRRCPQHPRLHQRYACRRGDRLRGPAAADTASPLGCRSASAGLPGIAASCRGKSPRIHPRWDTRPTPAA